MQDTEALRDKAIRLAAEIQVMGYEVLGARVLVLRDDPIDKSEGGIIIPDEAKRKPIRGTILAIGPGTVPEDMLEIGNLQVLDRIIFTKYNPTLIELRDSNGDLFEVEIMHFRDVYMRWSMDRKVA